MSTRYKISKSSLKEIQIELKTRGYSLRDIKEEIDADFRNFRYKGHSLSKETFSRLERLYGKSIDAEEVEYAEGKGERNQLTLEKNSSLAELVGIILGDGYIQQEKRDRVDRWISANRLVITLHQDEQRLQDRTAKLIYDVLEKEPSIHNMKNSRARQIILHSKEVIEELMNQGLCPGNKVENQVGVPTWIKSDQEFQKHCLRGLIDTDETIYLQSADSRKIIQFKNYSPPITR